MADVGSSFVEFVQDQLPDVVVRAMFGGHGLYLDGVFFAIAYDGRLYLKTDSTTVGAFVAAGMGPFTPPRGHGPKSYYEVPPEVLDDRETLRAWAQAAVEVARS
ncbi:MAG TPA: TfoX/Sxy family protein [Acidimicrobiales bacterium]|nr:TfoX/Sxy family protein [Acidimicrobiales bacterium]